MLENIVTEVFSRPYLNFIVVHVRNPNFTSARNNTIITIGNKKYKFKHRILGVDDGFLIEHTSDNLIGKQVKF